MTSTELGRIFAQDGFATRFEWGPTGAQALAAGVDVLVIVDVLSFTTAVDVAVARGARVYPYRHRDDAAATFARSIGATLAVDRQHVSIEAPYSLSPVSLAAIPADVRLVLPSPNGSAISVLAAELGRPILAGCLRNAAAVAAAAQARGDVVGIIASGERWRDDGLRPAYEDLMGAGAIIDRLPLEGRSPEAQAAVSAFHAARDQLQDRLLNCASGRELVGLGYARDVQIASELNVSGSVPVFRSGAYAADWTDKERAARLVEQLQEASDALIGLAQQIPERLWLHVARPGEWSAGKDAEHVADGNALHQWEVRSTLRQPAGRRPVVQRARLTAHLAQPEVIRLLKQRGLESSSLIESLTDQDLALPWRNRSLGEFIERVLIGHYRVHQAAIERKLRPQS